MKKNKELKQYRIYWKDGMVSLIKAENKENAKKKAKALHPFHPYPITKIECGAYNKKVIRNQKGGLHENSTIM